MSGRHSAGVREKAAKRPVRQPHSATAMPPTAMRIQARRRGGASSRPILITTGLEPQSSETSRAAAAPRTSMSFEGAAMRARQSIIPGGIIDGMKIGLIGLPKSGKTTLFNLLTGANVATSRYDTGRTELHTGVARVPDERVDRLTGI